MITTKTTTREATTGREPDAVLEALEALDAVLGELPVQGARMRRRIGRMVAEREAGCDYRDIIDTAPGPYVLEMVTAATRALESAGAELRRAEARALHDEGLTMDEIAERFGVTRQRISAVLRRS